MKELAENLKQAATLVSSCEVNERPYIEHVARLKLAVDKYLKEMQKELNLAKAGL